MYPTQTEADQTVEELQRGGVDSHPVQLSLHSGEKVSAAGV
jgi:hypothetical protein